MLLAVFCLFDCLSERLLLGKAVVHKLSVIGRNVPNIDIHTRSRPYW